SQARPRLRRSSRVLARMTPFPSLFLPLRPLRCGLLRLLLASSACSQAGKRDTISLPGQEDLADESMTKPTLEPHEPEAPIQGRGESDPARATSLALRLRAALLGLLDAHHRAGATSADPYEPSPTYHAMADGKFLSALAVARTLDLVDE